jgi:methyl-accepting chemotaxis protein
MNCWEFQKCKEELKNICPAYPDKGKDCWKVTGTMCKGIQQGTKEKKIHQCNMCNYYKSGHAHKF